MITARDKDILRRLAGKVREYAALPVMEERKRLWYAHNTLQADRPPIVMETTGFQHELLPALTCESESARAIEQQLLLSIVNHELVDDDKVIPDFFPINWHIHRWPYCIHFDIQQANDSKGRSLAYQFCHPIQDIRQDFGRLSKSENSVDREGTLAWQSCVESVIGDILPVKIKNDSLAWHYVVFCNAVKLMGMEQLFTAMMDTPDELHRLLSFIHSDLMEFVHWQQAENLLCLNNDNDYAGAGSYGFTTELPASKMYTETGRVTTADLWVNMNSQESIGISPAMYGEFVYPYHRKAAEEFGLVYYGCCEPVHTIWDDYLQHLPNLRKVSISAWCDELFMGNRLRNAGVIYCRKPSPNFLGVDTHLNEAAFSEHISATLQAAQGCHLEFSFRDVYTLVGDQTKAGQAVKIVRKLVDETWGR